MFPIISIIVDDEDDDDELDEELEVGEEAEMFAGECDCDCGDEVEAVLRADERDELLSDNVEAELRVSEAVSCATDWIICCELVGVMVPPLTFTN